jgi:hypothetical protein
VIISYNIHSLMKFEERIEWLLKELGDIRWDLIVFTETWRAERVEVWRTEHGHTWLGSGGIERQRGIGFLLHSRWNHLRFKPMSERVGVIDVRLCKGTVLRAIGVYMPHSAQPDEDVEGVYCILEEQCNEAKKKGYLKMLTGDFNAEVGTIQQYDDAKIIGPSSLPNRSDRGSWLLNWCTFNRYTILNTFGFHDANEYWTYTNGGTKKVLDYFLGDDAVSKYARTCHTLPGVDTGSDHRPSILTLRCKGPAKLKSKNRKRKCKQWKPDNCYVEHLSTLLSQRGTEYTDASTKAVALHEAMLTARAQTEAMVPLDEECARNTSQHDADIQRLILERKCLPSSGASAADIKRRRTELGKRIQKVIRQRRAQERTDKIKEVLAEFRGLNRLSAILGPPKANGIAEIRAADGNLKHDKEDIAEAFACFYEDLYRSRGCVSHSDRYRVSSNIAIDPFSLDELHEALKQMKPDKAADAQGICAEMISVDCPVLHDLILEVFNDVLKPGSEPPAEWRSSRLVVLFKKGDPTLTSNYRPIAILPILYKLFSRMLCGRIKPAIISQQSVDQAAYRQGFSTEDHLLTLTLLIEACAEWNMSLVLGLVDFEKAFDTVEHTPLWNALAELGVKAEYIDLLKMFYRRQDSTVLAGKESRPFTLERGVKQGDPISSLLFLAVMEVCFRRLKARWNKLNLSRAGAYYGIVVDDAFDPLTNLRFADDVVLFATSRSDVRKMLTDLNKEAGKFGLKLHAGKTKVFVTNPAARQTPISCAGFDVAVLQGGGSEKYLGRKLSVDDYHNAEFKNRLAMGWAAFFKLKEALCNRNVPIKDRIALFQSSVSPCVLYACGTWTMTSSMFRKLRSTQRRMFRWMIKSVPQADEPWPDYIRRATHVAEDMAFSCGATDWTEMQHVKKCKLAAKFEFSTDGRWASRLLHWKPWFRCLPYRDVGHPSKRWTDHF